MAVNSSGVNLSAASAADVGQAGANGGTYTVQICNRTASTVEVQLGVSATSATFENERKILQAETIAANGSLTYAPVVCLANEYIVAESDTTDVNAVMMGHDE